MINPKNAFKSTLIGFVYFCCVLNCLPAIGQVMAGLGKQQEPEREVLGKKITDDDYNVVYKLAVTPAAEPIPAFKYRLTVEPHKTIPGNAITHYLRSQGESSRSGPWGKIREEFGWEEVDDWYDLERDASTIPLESLKKASGSFDSYVKNHLVRATLCREAEWGLAIEDLRGFETIQFLLPSIQQTRDIARALMLQNRLALIEGRFDDSIDRIRMTYVLGQHVSKLEMLVCSLVGMAEVGMANECMIDLISTEGSPNMYWALSELPEPIVSIRDAIRLESSLPLRMFPVLSDVQTAQHSKEHWNELVQELVKSFADIGSSISVGGPQDDFTSRQLFISAFALAGYTGAKKNLIDSGLDPDAVEKMPVLQVILLEAAKEMERMSQEMEKTYYVPYPKASKMVEEIEDRLSRPMTSLGGAVARILLPAMQQVRQAEVRVQTEVNTLIVIEAIRHHLATKNELPESLDDLELPVRNNPYTDLPFQYELNGNTAVIEIPREAGSIRPVRYEITLKK